MRSLRWSVPAVALTWAAWGCDGSPGAPADDADGTSDVDAPVEAQDDGAPDVGEDDAAFPDRIDDVPGDVEPEVDGPTGCPVADDLGAGSHDLSIDFGGRARAFQLHVPSSYDPAVPTPLVLNLHGFGSAAWQQVLFSEMNGTADARGFIVMYPDGYLSSWNAGSCCGTASTLGIDDVGFLRAAVADASAKLCINPRRIYATGMSNGGYMSHRLGCEAADLFAAVAPVAGAMGIADCAPSRPVPVIAFHGTTDPLVPYDDGHAAYLGWVARNGCSDALTRTFHGESYCETYADCGAGTQVTFCTLVPMGHCWPGWSETLCLAYLGAYNDDIDANERMWEFFEQFELP